MKSTLLVSERGQITLPSMLRKKMGIKGGGVVTVEEQDGKLVISPATVLGIEMYNDDQIKAWDEADRFLARESKNKFPKTARNKK